MRQRSLTFAGLRFATAAWQVDQTTGALLQIDKKIPSCMCSTTVLHLCLNVFEERVVCGTTATEVV